MNEERYFIYVGWTLIICYCTTIIPQDAHKQEPALKINHHMSLLRDNAHQECMVRKGETKERDM